MTRLTGLLFAILLAFSAHAKNCTYNRLNSQICEGDVVLVYGDVLGAKTTVVTRLEDGIIKNEQCFSFGTLGGCMFWYTLTYDAYDAYKVLNWENGKGCTYFSDFNKKVCHGQVFTTKSGHEAKISFIFENGVIEYAPLSEYISSMLGFKKYIGSKYIHVGNF